MEYSRWKNGYPRFLVWGARPGRNGSSFRRRRGSGAAKESRRKAQQASGGRVRIYHFYRQYPVSIRTAGPGIPRPRMIQSLFIKALTSSIDMPGLYPVRGSGFSIRNSPITFPSKSYTGRTPGSARKKSLARTTP